MQRMLGNHGLCLLLIAVSALLAGCSSSMSDPEAELREWVATAEAAAEDRDRRGFMALVSPSYADGRGNDAESINKIVLATLLRQKSISVLTKIDSIEVSAGTAAEMSVTVGMAGTRSQSFGLDADAYRFELDLVREAEGWQLIAARWGALGSELR